MITFDTGWAMQELEAFVHASRFNHEEPLDVDEKTGPEYLAALSALARWVDDAEVGTVP